MAIAEESCMMDSWFSTINDNINIIPLTEGVDTFHTLGQTVEDTVRRRTESYGNHIRNGYLSFLLIWGPWHVARRQPWSLESNVHSIWRIIYVRLNYRDSFHVQLEGNPKGHTRNKVEING